MILNGIDGKDHINIYSKGKTELGRFLSNFSLSPINLKNDGYFKTIEGYWHWLEIKDSRFRNLCGYDAKQLSKKLEKNKNVENFEEKIKEAIDVKLKQHPDFLHLLGKSTLPLCHYYYFNGFKKDVKHNWLVKHLEDRRNKMKKYLSNKEFVIVAGSHSFNSEEEYHFLYEILMNYLVKTEYYTNLSRKLIIVSGNAEGADKFGLKFAKKTGLNTTKFIPNWKKYGKKAKCLRNQRMARFSNTCFIFDKGTNGTINMLENAKNYNLNLNYYNVDLYI